MTARPSFVSDDPAARLLEAVRVPPPSGGFTLWWLGQSGFAIRYGEEMAVVDPYLSDSLTKKYADSPTPHVRIHDRLIAPEALALAPVTALVSTHHHTDHLDPGTLTPIVAALRTQNREPPLAAPEASRALAAERSTLAPSAIIGMDEGTTARLGSFELTGVAAAHPAIERDGDGRCRYLGYVIRFGGWTIYHSGDTLRYEGQAERLRPFGVDAAILPINGKVGNMSGADAARLGYDIGARFVVPCHYDMFSFNTADPAAEFVPACESLGQACRLPQLGEPMTFASPQG